MNIQTTQDLEIRNGVCEHVVNFVSCRWVCTRCADNNNIEEYSTCCLCAPKTLKAKKKGESLLVFKRVKYWSFYTCDEPLEMFVDWLIGAFDSGSEVLIFSHNGGR